MLNTLKIKIHLLIIFILLSTNLYAREPFAKQIQTDITDFGNNLPITNDTAQKAFKTINDLDIKNLNNTLQTVTDNGATTTNAVTASEYTDSSSSGTSTQWADSYDKRVDTWGDGLKYTSQVASVDYNTTNLKITSTEINTIQDINTTANTSFNTIASTQATGTAAQYKSFKIALSYVASISGIIIGDAFGIRIRRIDADTNEISGEFVVEGAAVEFTSNRLGEPI